MNRAVDLWVVYELLKRLTTPFSETDAYRLGIIDDRGNVLRPQKSLSPRERKSWTSFDILVNNLKRLLARLPFGRVRFASYMAAMWLLREPKAKLMSESHVRRSFQKFLLEETTPLVLPTTIPSDYPPELKERLKDIRDASFPWLRELHSRGIAIKHVRALRGNYSAEDLYEVGEGYIHLTFWSKSVSGVGVTIGSTRSAFRQRGFNLKQISPRKAAEIITDLWVATADYAKRINDGLQAMKEDAPANAAATGAVAGLTGDPPVMKRPKFAGHDVFTVNDDVWSRCRMGKRKHARYEAYVGEDETGKAIRDFGVANPKAPIMLQHHKTGAFMYLRYGSDHSAYDHINPRRESKKQAK